MVKKKNNRGKRIRIRDLWSSSLDRERKTDRNYKRNYFSLFLLFINIRGVLSGGGGYSRGKQECRNASVAVILSVVRIL